jgi:hypothetical protein
VTAVAPHLLQNRRGRASSRSSAVASFKPRRAPEPASRERLRSLGPKALSLSLTHAHLHGDKYWTVPGSSRARAPSCDTRQRRVCWPSHPCRDDRPRPLGRPGPLATFWRHPALTHTGVSPSHAAAALTQDASHPRGTATTPNRTNEARTPPRRPGELVIRFAYLAAAAELRSFAFAAFIAIIAIIAWLVGGDLSSPREPHDGSSNHGHGGTHWQSLAHHRLGKSEVEKKEKRERRQEEGGATGTRNKDGRRRLLEKKKGRCRNPKPQPRSAFPTDHINESPVDRLGEVSQAAGGQGTAGKPLGFWREGIVTGAGHCTAAPLHGQGLQPGDAERDEAISAGSSGGRPTSKRGGRRVLERSRRARVCCGSGLAAAPTGAAAPNAPEPQPRGALGGAL